MKQVHIVGGGLAGAAAGWDLARRGRRVVLWESRAALGGRVSGVIDPETGLEMDNGQHVQLGACTVSRELFAAWGIPMDWQARAEVTYGDRDGVTGSLRESLLPAPLHLGPSFLGWPLLSIREKAAAAHVFTRALLLDDAACAGLDGVSFATWLGEVPARVAQRLFRPIVEATLNGTMEMCSAAGALFVIRHGFLLDHAGARLGVLRGTQGRDLTERIHGALRAAGVEVRVGARVDAVLADERGDTAAGVRAAGTDHRGDVILAVPHDRVKALVPEAWQRHRFFAPLDGWRYWPIVNVAILAQGVPPGFTMRCFPDHECQWIFRRPVAGRGDWFIASISAAFHHLEAGADALAQRIEGEFRQLVPGFASAHIVRRMVLPQLKATFAAHPGVAARRLPASTPFPGLTLAGAWTATGWPDTQESALRSGLAAAAAVLNARP